MNGEMKVPSTPGRSAKKAAKNSTRLSNLGKSMNFRLNDGNTTRYAYEESGVFAIPGQDTTTTTTDTTDHSTAHEAGNTIGGQYAAATSGSVHSVTITQESNVGAGLATTTTTTSDSYNDGSTKTGNSIAGNYSSTGAGHTATVVAQSSQTSGDSFTLDSTETGSYTSEDSGNTIEGTDSSSQSGSSHYHMTKSDTYADGSDSQAVQRDGADLLSSSTSNPITGEYSDSNSGTVTTTVARPATRHPYTSSSTDTYAYSDSDAGNSISGHGTSATSETDSGSQTRTTADGALSVTTANDCPVDTSTRTGNSIQGDYTSTATKQETFTTDETSGAAGNGFSLHSVETFSSATSGGGNSISGDCSSTENDSISTTLHQWGTDAAGTFDVTETTADSPTLVTTGNSVSGQYHTVQTGAATYTLDQTNTAASSNYELTGGGTQTYSRTDDYNTVSGDRTSNETGSDAYSLTETGADASGAYSQTLTGTDAYTTSVTSNDLDGGYTRTITGSGDYTLSTSPLPSGEGLGEGGQGEGDAGDTTSTTGTHQFTTTGSGNYIDGQLSLSATGVDRYMLLRGFNNSSNGALGTAGTADYSSVGTPLFLGSGVEGPTGGGARAAAADAFFANVGTMPYEHCFAAGTAVLMADGSYKAIETIQRGEMVLAVSDRDPEGPVEARRVVAVYHNAPSPDFGVARRRGPGGNPRRTTMFGAGMCEPKVCRRNGGSRSARLGRRHSHHAQPSLLRAWARRCRRGISGSGTVSARGWRRIQVDQYR